MLLADKMTFIRQVDLLLQYEVPATERREKWQNPEDRFENFIADSLIYALSGPKRSQIDALLDGIADVEIVVDVESIESLLKSRVKAFTKAPVRICIGSKIMPFLDETSCDSS
jgi:hypothetical protein